MRSGRSLCGSLTDVRFFVRNRYFPNRRTLRQKSIKGRVKMGKYILKRIGYMLIVLFIL